MSKAATIEKRKAILRARGVPEGFVEAMATRQGPTSSLLFILLVLIVLITAIAAMIFAVAYHKAGIAHILVNWLHADAGPALLFQGGGAIDLVAIIITPLVCIALLRVAMAVATSSQFRPWPAYDAQAGVLRSLKPGETLETLKPNPHLQALAGLPDEAAFLAAIRPPRPTLASLMGLYGALVLIFGAFAVPLAIRSFDYTTVTTEQVVVHDIGGAKAYRLADARHAYVLCYDKAHDGFGYRLAFADRTLELWDWRDEAHDLDPRGILDRLETIDTRLLDLGVPVHRMPADEGHACVAKMAKRTGADQRLLERLVYGGK